MSEPHRLHPAAIAVWAADSVRQFGLALVALLLFRGGESPLTLAVLAIGIAGPLLRWARFTYRLSDGVLTVKGGLLFRWRREIPLARVQSVDTVQKLRHRLFGVVELRIEAAGGGSTEAALVALDPEEADRLRSLIQREELEVPEAPAPPLVSLGPAELVLAGATGGRVAVIAVLLGYLQQFAPDDYVEDAVRRLFGGGGVAIAVAAVVVVFLLVSFAFSIVATVLVYWGFTVRRERDRLRIERGLLDRRHSTVALRRLQAVEVNENLLRRSVGLASLSVVIAGYAGSSEEQQETSMLLPVGRRDDTLELAALVLDAQVDLQAVVLQPGPRRALAPRVAGWMLFGAVAGTVGVSAVGALGALALLFALVGIALGWAQWRSLGHLIAGDMVLVRSGLWVRKTTIVPLANLQHLKLKAGPLQKLLRTASVELGVPRRRPIAHDLDRAVAGDRFDSLSRAMVPRLPPEP